MPDEEVLRAAHAGIRLERNAAEHREHLRPATPAQVVPEQIAQQTGGHPQHDGESKIHLAHTGQRPGGEQHRDRGNRQPDLLGEHHGEEHAAAVPDQELRHVIHESPYK